MPRKLINRNQANLLRLYRENPDLQFYVKSKDVKDVRDLARMGLVEFSILKNAGMNYQDLTFVWIKKG